jgi:hypothetical protein
MVKSPGRGQTPAQPSHDTEPIGGSAEQDPILPPAANVAALPEGGSLRAGDPFLRLAAEMVTDLEAMRIANENRIRTLTTPIDQADEDGICRGFGLPETDPSVQIVQAIVEGIHAQEKVAIKQLEKRMRKLPLGAWGKANKGVGDKQLARLLATLDDPYWNSLHDRPRTVSELWAYCGFHTLPAGHAAFEIHPMHAGGDNIAARRRKGVKSNWSTEAKTRAWLVAAQCMKTPGAPYRDIYLARRMHTAGTHPEWTKGHSHNDGIRIVAKVILRDLWIASRALHMETS